MRRKSKKKTMENVPHLTLEELNQTLFEKCADGIFITDRQGNFIDVNPRYCEMLGYSRDKLLEFSIADLIPVEDLTRDPLQLDAFQAGKTLLQERRLRCKNGRVLTAEISARILSDGSLLGTVRDISTRIQTQEALRTSEERLQLALEAAQMGEWDWNLITGEVEWSQRCKALYGLSPDTPMSYERFLQALHPEDRDRIDNALRRAVDERTGYDELKRTIWPDGTTHWTASRGHVLCDAAGKPIRMVGVTFDISRWKEAEEEHQTHLWFLESLDQVNRVIQGTNDLEKMMRDALDVVLSIFDCDRAFLGYPCDPEAVSWHVIMERTKPEFPGAFALKIEMPVDQDIAKMFRTLRATDGPVTFGPGLKHPLPTPLPELEKKHLVTQSSLAMAIYPKTGEPYLFGLQQVAFARIWTPREERLFQEIGRRISDALTSLLSYQYLRESEEKYRLIAENTADVISIHDLNLKPIYTSPSIKNLRGYTVEEALQQDMAEVLTPKSLKKAKEILADHLELEKDPNADPNRSIRLELEEYHKDGHTIWVELAASFLRDREMKATGILTITRDITKRRQAERQLIESEQKFRSLAEYIPYGILRYNDKMQLIYINQNAEKIIDLNLRSFVGKDPSKEILEKAPPSFLKKLEKVIRTGQPEELEAVFRNPEGELHTHYIRLVSERNDKGTVIGALAVARDITEILRSQESLRKLSYAVEQSPVSIVITDTMGTIEYVNPKFTEVTGFTSEEAIGQNPRILKSGNMPEGFYENLWNTILNGGVWQGEFHNRKKNHDLYYESASISPIFNDEGTITHFISVKEDITERKRLEEQFRQAQKMEAIGLLAGGIAHDFNNMLGAIIGHAEIALLQMDPNQAFFKNLQEIKTAAERSANLSRQLLAFARKQTIIPKVLDLNVTIEGILKMLKRLIGEEIELAWQPGARIWPVYMDPSQIDQIMANVCINARDAIPGVGKIIIETENVTLDEAYCGNHIGFIPGEYVQLSISDNGRGMNHETLEKIFEPFFTTKEIGKGTGLGMATVYGIIKQNNGYINVYSEPEYGSTFKIYLPRHAVKSEQIGKESPVASIIQGSETILLVEDDSIVLDITKQMLEKFGYTVLTSSTPKDAIRHASEYPGEIDMLLTDMVLPEMTGPDLEKKIKILCPEVKCLFMSGYTGNVIAHHGVLDEGVNFIQKPFSMQQLAPKVREVLDSK